ncbi:MAG: hypothetical protein IPP08_12590 [Chlorobiota bacterium]|nr:hypothetical protein [Chlorobiota bacterium]QQS66573.1 MAG: hypothetical protein IPP08_12590 [Chlorobiota bacterium]
MEIPSIFISTGVAGIVGFLFYLIIPKMLPMIKEMQNQKYKFILLLVLSVGMFALTITGLYLFYLQNLNSEGGNQPHSNTSILSSSFLLNTAYAQPKTECGVNTGNFELYLSFVNNKPYFTNLCDNGKFIINLINLDIDKNVATFKIEIGNNPPSFLNLPLNNQKIFIYNNCKFKLTYIGFSNFNAGIRYFFRNRYVVKYNIVRIE